MFRNTVLSALLVLGFSAQEAFAYKTINFKFRVHSYGTRLYACDAGLRNTLSEPGDYFSGGFERWQPSSWSGGVYTPGQWNPFVYPTDYRTFAASYAADALNPITYLTGDTLSNASYKLGRALISAGSESSASIGITDGSLDFFLNSDHYASEYFIDFCYEGPQGINTAYLPTDVTKMDLKLNSVVTATNLIPGTGSYLDNSDVRVESVVNCRKYGGTVSNVTQSLGASPNLLSLTGDIASTPDSGLIDFTSTTVPAWTDKELGLQGIPRYCVIRYIFSEQNKTVERANWDGEHSKFDIYLKVEPIKKP